MRQISRFLARTKLPGFQQQTIAKVLENFKSLSHKNGSRRNGNWSLQVSDMQHIKLRTKLLHHMAEFHKNYLRREALSCGMVTAFPDGNKSGFKTVNRGTIITQSESLNNILKETINRNRNMYDLFSRRKQNIRDAIENRKQLINEILETSKGSLNDKLKIRKKLLRETLQTRRNKLRDTEQKVMDHGKALLKDLREAKQVVKVRMEQVIEKENIYTIPNFLCVTRIAFSPYLAYLIVTENFEFALTFMAVAGFSDWLDGWIARNYKSQSTKIGSFLDPMADKVLIGTLFLTLTYVDLIPVPLTALIVGRDIALVIAGFVIRYNSLPPPRTFTRYFDASHATAQLAPTLISKINTAIQLVLVASTLAAPVVGYVGHPALNVLCYITAASTVMAAASYITSKDTYKYIQPK